jgi:hypothetical protein
MDFKHSSGLDKKTLSSMPCQPDSVYRLSTCAYRKLTQQNRKTFTCDLNMLIYHRALE